MSLESLVERIIPLLIAADTLESDCVDDPELLCYVEAVKDSIRNLLSEAEGRLDVT